ncbi:MAG: hypothetical protein QXM25_00260 [Nitrososphaerales archaeon]
MSRLSGEKEDEAYHLIIMPGVPLSIILKITKELNLEIVEKDAYTYPPGEEKPTKIKALAFKSKKKEILEKARQRLVEYFTQRIEEMQEK